MHKEGELTKDSGYEVDGSHDRADETNVTKDDVEIRFDGQTVGGDERLPKVGGSIHEGI